MKNVMVRAWEIAKSAVVKFGGKVKEYFSQALTMAWKETKAPKYAEVELKPGNSKCKTWIAQIVGFHPVYKLSRKFLNNDTTDQYGYKIFFLNDGVYEYNNGKRRGFFRIVGGQEISINQDEAHAFVAATA
ncbi:hypothetical protein [Paenibacillus lutrae]|nr:hypothetical protein [Paenibacillus lutrae]